MPNFKKSDGFSLGGNPFTMKKGSKEINTEGSFRQESTDKMGSYGSPLFAIAGRDPSSAGAAYDDSSVTDIGEAVDAGMAEGQEVREQVSPQQEANDTISDQTETTPSKGNAEGSLGTTQLSDANPTGGAGGMMDKDKLKDKLSSIASIFS
tara:strand:- start:301 stop:753 length:453 start_codon:yes stop_codon:yes gene_type:complete